MKILLRYPWFKQIKSNWAALGSCVLTDSNRKLRCLKSNGMCYDGESQFSFLLLSFESWMFYFRSCCLTHFQISIPRRPCLFFNPIQVNAVYIIYKFLMLKIFRPIAVVAAVIFFSAAETFLFLCMLIRFINITCLMYPLLAATHNNFRIIDILALISYA